MYTLAAVSRSFRYTYTAVETPGPPTRVAHCGDAEKHAIRYMNGSHFSLKHIPSIPILTYCLACTHCYCDLVLYYRIEWFVNNCIRIRTDFFLGSMLMRLQSMYTNLYDSVVGLQCLLVAKMFTYLLITCLYNEYVLPTI